MNYGINFNKSLRMNLKRECKNEERKESKLNVRTNQENCQGEKDEMPKPIKINISERNKRISENN